MKNCNHANEETWWENDARGIPLAKVCQKCVKDKLRSFNPAVLTEDQRERIGAPQQQPRYEEVVEEQIEPD